MKKLSSMWTSNVEIEACLDSRIFRIKELRILFRGKFNFSKFNFFFACTYFHESRVVPIFACINFRKFTKISTSENLYALGTCRAINIEEFQRRVQNPVKHLRCRVLQKFQQLKALFIFAKSSILYIYSEGTVNYFCKRI